MADGPDFNSIEGAWRSLIKAMPGMDSPDFEGGPTGIANVAPAFGGARQ